jgi:hypothetical protein
MHLESLNACRILSTTVRSFSWIRSSPRSWLGSVSASESPKSPSGVALATYVTSLVFIGPTDGSRRPVRPTASELSRVFIATVHLVPLRADLEPTRSDGRLRALGGFAVLVIDEAEAPATVNGDSARVVHEG